MIPKFIWLLRMTNSDPKSTLQKARNSNFEKQERKDKPKQAVKKILEFLNCEISIHSLVIIIMINCTNMLWLSCAKLRLSWDSLILSFEVESKITLRLSYIGVVFNWGFLRSISYSIFKVFTIDISLHNYILCTKVGNKDKYL